jgi:hypothetical protein
MMIAQDIEDECTANTAATMTTSLPSPPSLGGTENDPCIPTESSGYGASILLPDDNDEITWKRQDNFAVHCSRTIATSQSQEMMSIAKNNHNKQPPTPVSEAYQHGLVSDKIDPPTNGMRILTQYVEQSRSSIVAEDDDDDDDDDDEASVMIPPSPIMQYYADDSSDQHYRLPSPPSMTTSATEGQERSSGDGDNNENSSRQNAAFFHSADDVWNEKPAKPSALQECRDDSCEILPIRRPTSSNLDEVGLNKGVEVMHDDALNTLDNNVDDSPTITETKVMPTKRIVHFSDPLVSRCEYRPKTDLQDISRLYFSEQELEEYEEDREQTSTEHVELLIDDCGETNGLHVVLQEHKHHNPSFSFDSAN